MSNKLFGEVVGLSVKQMNNLERLFLSAINYSLYLSKQDFVDFLLHKMTQKKCVPPHFIMKMMPSHHEMAFGGESPIIPSSSMMMMTHAAAAQQTA